MGGGQGLWGCGQDRRCADRGRKGVAKNVGAPPGAVRVRSWLCGCSQGPWGHGQGRGGTSRGRGVRPRPWGPGQGLWGCGPGRRGADRGVAKTVGVPPGAVKVRSWPCGCSQGTWGHG